MCKRTLDVFVALVALAIVLPVLIILGGVIRLRLGAPAFFRQVRPGIHGKPFVMYKFRTMNDMRDAHGALLPDVKRLTRLGVFLRATSMDELPELLNVLRGEMSLVGPRPLLSEYLPLYSCEQRRRHDVRPGLTGWAQINGRNAISWEKKFELDVWYVDNRTLWLDLKILFLTSLKVMRRDGISHDGEATMTRFSGSQDKNINDG